MIDRTLPVDSDFEAFCIDNFPAAHRKFSSQMDRTHKVNILLQYYSSSELVRVLSKDALNNHINPIAARARFYQIFIFFLFLFIVIFCGIGIYFFTQIHSLIEEKKRHEILGQPDASAPHQVLDMTEVNRPVLVPKIENPRSYRSLRTVLHKTHQDARYSCNIPQRHPDKFIAPLFDDCLNKLLDALNSASLTVAKFRINLHKANKYVIELRDTADSAVSRTIYQSEFSVCLERISRFQQANHDILIDCHMDANR